MRGQAEADARLAQQRDELEAQHRLQLQQELAAREEAHASQLEWERASRVEAEEDLREAEAEVEAQGRLVAMAEKELMEEIEKGDYKQGEMNEEMEELQRWACLDFIRCAFHTSFRSVLPHHFSFLISL